MGLGIYVSVPFCRAKCSFCNFASGVFGAERVGGYLEQLLAEMRGVREYAAGLGVPVPDGVDSVYLGGGTPSLLEPEAIERLFGGMREVFAVEAGAEITVECAPGQMTDASLEAFQRAGVNRLSFGVQSFVDAECAAVGRSHTGAGAREELRRMQAAGVQRVGIDLIVGLPHQTEASWRRSVEEAIESGVEHVSLYMLEVDEGSRLGKEALLGGVRYGVGALPHEDRVADWYAAASEWLGVDAGVEQYEISNFARVGGQSRHNRKYWERADYLGFGLDAHSMLRCGVGGVRWAYGREMDSWDGGRIVDRVGVEEAFEESLFLGLRLVKGVRLDALRREFGVELVGNMLDGVGEMVEAGLCGVSAERLWLTGAGRMASNEVFGRLLLDGVEETR